MIVLDTNVVSEALRPTADETVKRWLNEQRFDSLYLSSVSLAELLFGIRAMPNGARRNQVANALDGLVALFSGRILAFDHDAARRFAEIAAERRAAGRPVPTVDGFIAATAAAHGFAIATRNTRDFDGTGVEVINPWREQV